MVVQEFQESLVSDVLLNLVTWCSKHFQEAQKVLVLGWGVHEHTFGEEFGKDASEGPNVDGTSVVGGVIEVQLRCSVVLGSHIFGQVVVLVDLPNLYIGLAKVTDLDVPVLIDQDIEWFEIAVDDTLGVHVENTFHDAVGEVADVIGAQLVLVESDEVH